MALASGSSGQPSPGAIGAQPAHCLGQHRTGLNFGDLPLSDGAPPLRSGRVVQDAPMHFVGVRGLVEVALGDAVGIMGG